LTDLVPGRVRHDALVFAMPPTRRALRRPSDRRLAAGFGSTPRVSKLANTRARCRFGVRPALPSPRYSSSAATRRPTRHD